MWMPNWLYKSLPFCYLALGIFLLSVFGLSVAAGISAAALFLAAGLTFSWRRSHKVVWQNSRHRDEWEQRRARRVRSMSH